MTKIQYMKKIDGKTPEEVEQLLKKLTYNEIYQLWHEITHNTLTIDDEPKEKLPRIKKELKNFYIMDIYARTMINFYEPAPTVTIESDDNGGEA